MMSRPTYRAASASDLSAIGALLQASKLPLEGVKDCIDDFIVAESDDAIVGSVGLERYGDYAILRSAAVSPAVRGGGVGRQLVERIIDKAKGDGVTEMFLLTTTAEEYFPKFGFDRVARDSVPAELHVSEQFRSLCPDTAVVMRKRL